MYCLVDGRPRRGSQRSGRSTGREVGCRIDETTRSAVCEFLHSLCRLDGDLPGGTVSLAGAASSCSESGTTADVVLDQSGRGTPTTLSQDVSGNLTVGGIVCAPFSSINGIDMTVTSGAASQVVVLSQGGAGRVPCSALIKGTLRSQDSLEVLGASGESISVGDTSSGTGVNLDACSSVGTVTGLGSYELAGSGAVTLSASGAAPFLGALTIPATFLVGTASETLNEGTVADTVNFSSCPPRSP